MPVAVPAVNKDSDVMIPVQEYQSLLSQHNENCVSEFWQLAEMKSHVKLLISGVCSDSIN